MTGTAVAPRRGRFNVGNLAAARQGVGVGGSGSGRFLSINRDTGAMTVGSDQEPFDNEALYAIRVPEIMHGYYVYGESGAAPDKTAMVSMVSDKPRPQPAGGYASYPEPGARAAIELKLHPVEGGEPIEFTSHSVSHDNRINNLIGAIIRQDELPDGQLGFVNPVIRVVAGSYPHRKWGRIHHFDFKLADWCDDSGSVLLSQYQGGKAVEGSSTPAPAPEGGGDDDGEQLISDDDLFGDA